MLKKLTIFLITFISIIKISHAEYEIVGDYLKFPMDFSEEKVNSMADSLEDSKYFESIEIEIDDEVMKFEGTLVVFKKFDFSFDASISEKFFTDEVLTGFEVDIENLNVSNYKASKTEKSEKLMEEFTNKLIRENFEEQMVFELADINVLDEKIELIVRYPMNQ